MRASESNSPAFYWDAKKHSHRLTYLAFDLLYLDGYDLRGASLCGHGRVAL
jgi:ATP-dependent DNA ligase